MLSHCQPHTSGKAITDMSQGTSGAIFNRAKEQRDIGLARLAGQPHRRTLREPIIATGSG